MAKKLEGKIRPPKPKYFIDTYLTTEEEKTDWFWFIMLILAILFVLVYLAYGNA